MRHSFDTPNTPEPGCPCWASGSPQNEPSHAEIDNLPLLPWSREVVACRESRHDRNEDGHPGVGGTLRQTCLRPPLRRRSHESLLDPLRLLDIYQASLNCTPPGISPRGCLSRGLRSRGEMKHYPTRGQSRATNTVDAALQGTSSHPSEGYQASDSSVNTEWAQCPDSAEERDSVDFSTLSSRSAGRRGSGALADGDLPGGEGGVPRPGGGPSFGGVPEVARKGAEAFDERPSVGPDVHACSVAIGAGDLAMPSGCPVPR